MKSIKKGLFLSWFGIFAVVQTMAAPYPYSTVITGITFDQSTLVKAAPGSDQFGYTMASDNNIYVAWGDGGGFGGTNSTGRVSLGVARLQGMPPSWQGINVWGGVSPLSSQSTTPGKTSNGVISVNGVIYLYVSEQDVWTNNTLWKSSNLGMTWQNVRKIFTEADGAFTGAGIIQFGPDYQGARDRYIYGYDNRFYSDGLALFRVDTSLLENRSNYEFFTGLDGTGNPQWGSDISQKQRVFIDPNGTEWGVTCTYHPYLNRYLLAVRHNGDSGDWGLFDAPEPWGPWTTVGYGTDFPGWVGSQDPNGASAGRPAYMHNFPQKWMSSDGTTLWHFSDRGDQFNIMKATLTLGGPPDTVPPNAPSNLQMSSRTESSISLSWTAPAAASDGDLASSYIVKRNGVQVGNPSSASFTDNGLSENTSYNYEVYSRDDAGNLSLAAATGSLSTLADNTGPAIVSASCTGDPAKVTVVFSEALDATSAETASNYGINNGISISAATLGADQKTVTLTTSDHVEGTTYTLTVNNLKDNSQAKNAIAANSTKDYQYVVKLVITLVQYMGSFTPPTVMDDGFETGAVEANDRTGATWSGVPASLTGQTYLLTARDDKSSALAEDAVMYRVNASAACTVFVLVDAGLPAPSWIASDGWEATSLAVSGSGDPYDIYKKVFPAGNIDLKRQVGSASEGTGYVFVLADGEPTVEALLSAHGGSRPYLSARPNPFNPAVVISMSDSHVRATRRVALTLAIYDVHGRMVHRLSATSYQLSAGITWNAQGMPAGLYIVKLSLASRTYIKNIFLVK